MQKCLPELSPECIRHLYHRSDFTVAKGEVSYMISALDQIESMRFQMLKAAA